MVFLLTSHFVLCFVSFVLRQVIILHDRNSWDMLLTQMFGLSLAGHPCYNFALHIFKRTENYTVSFVTEITMKSFEYTKPAIRLC